MQKKKTTDLLTIQLLQKNSMNWKFKIKDKFWADKKACLTENETIYESFIRKYSWRWNCPKFNIIIKLKR